MLNPSPKISVIIPSYNHAKYVGEAIKSVLAQDFTDFELLIADDCSQDNSRQIIGNFQDDRIHTFFLDENIGPCEILKYLIQHASGTYIALLNSDDFWETTKLSKQIAFLEANPEYAACFSWADLVNENAKSLSLEECPSSQIFIEHNRTKEEWFYRFFYQSNCICHPSVLIKRSVYEEIGYYNPFFRQLPDFDLWVRLVQHYNFHIIEEVLTHLRWHNDDVMPNTSAPTVQNFTRDKNESFYILYEAIVNMTPAFFKKVFSDKMRNPHAVHEDEIRCEKFFVLCGGTYWGDDSKFLAIPYFYHNLNNANCIQLLKEHYLFSSNDFFTFVASYGIDGEYSQYAKYVKYHEDCIAGHHAENERLQRALKTSEEHIAQLNSTIQAVHTQLNELTASSMAEKETLTQSLNEYKKYVDKLHRTLPFRIYHKLKRILKR